jgi:hypothetical protein
MIQKFKHTLIIPHTTQFYGGVSLDPNPSYITSVAIVAARGDL